MSLKPSLNLIQLQGVPILQQLRFEEALLRADAENWCLINQHPPPAIVLGISNQLEDVLVKKRYLEEPVPLFRRFSGGGAVFVDEGTLFVTFICNSELLPIAPFPQPILNWSATLYHPLFSTLPFRLVENDYVIGEKKWGGNALSIIKNRWLHHCSLLWDYRESHMEYLSTPSKAPSYRHQRTHAEFLCKLRDHWPQADLFLDAFIHHLGERFLLKKSTKEQLESIEARPHRKATLTINLSEFA